MVKKSERGREWAKKRVKESKWEWVSGERESENDRGGRKRESERV